jgi:hypothetical protein
MAVLFRVDCDLLGVDCDCPLRELWRSRVELEMDVVVAILYSVRTLPWDQVAISRVKGTCWRVGGSPFLVMKARDPWTQFTREPGGLSLVRHNDGETSGDSEGGEGWWSADDGISYLSAPAERCGRRSEGLYCRD